jgi:hypothetical protein
MSSVVIRTRLMDRPNLSCNIESFEGFSTLRSFWPCVRSTHVNTMATARGCEKVIPNFAHFSSFLLCACQSHLAGACLEKIRFAGDFQMMALMPRGMDACKVVLMFVAWKGRSLVLKRSLSNIRPDESDPILPPSID